ncbi:hypothetical protein [Achromobacter insolitus]|uniref:hypothetical protein n=1 Tax=Achromobacter insolitus TaxID=217204 RepID=UPI000AD86B8E|nr:hypothetical protein [Achromobacter insolitus]
MALLGKRSRKGATPVVVWTLSPIKDEHCVVPRVYVDGDCQIDPAESAIFAVGGCGVLAGKFVRHTNDANEVLEGRGEGVVDAARSIRGSLCLYAWDALTRAVYLVPDPFGAALVFYYQGNGISAASSDLGALVARLRDLGQSLTLSIKYAVEMAFVGNAGLIHTPYDEIRVLPNFSYFSISSEECKVRPYNWARNVFNDTPAGLEGADFVANDILMNTQAAISAPSHRKVAHLTAGFDSRLVLATILHHGAKDAFTWHTTGGTNSLDVAVAQELAQAEGLRMSHYPGYGFSSNPRGHEFRIRAPLDYSEGMISVGPHERNFHDGSILLSGGYGEILRSFFDVRFVAEGMSTAEQFERISWVGRKVNPERSAPLMKKDFSLYLHDEFKKHLARGSDFGIKPNALLDYYYLANRNRYWVGLGARLWSDVCYKFDPLYSLAGAAVGLSQARDQRISNFLGLDIMFKVRPQLLQHRYGREVICDAYRAIRPVPMMNSTAGPVLAGSPWIDGPYGEGREWSDPLCREDAFPRLTKSDLEAAKKVRVSPRQWASRHLIRDRVRELMEIVEDEDLRSVFDMTELSLMLKSAPSTMGSIRLLNSLHGSLLWMDARTRE